MERRPGQHELPQPLHSASELQLARCSGGRSPVVPFGGPPAKMDYRKGFPYCSLSTGGPRRGSLAKKTNTQIDPRPSLQGRFCSEACQTADGGRKQHTSLDHSPCSIICLTDYAMHHFHGRQTFLLRTFNMFLHWGQTLLSSHQTRESEALEASVSEALHGFIPLDSCDFLSAMVPLEQQLLGCDICPANVALAGSGAYVAALAIGRGEKKAAYFIKVPQGLWVGLAQTMMRISPNQNQI